MYLVFLIPHSDRNAESFPQLHENHELKNESSQIKPPILDAPSVYCKVLDSRSVLPLLCVTYHDLLHSIAITGIGIGWGAGVGVFVVGSGLEIVRHLGIKLSGSLLSGASAASASLLGSLASGLGSSALLVRRSRFRLGLGLSLWLAVMLVRISSADEWEAGLTWYARQESWQSG